MRYPIPFFLWFFPPLWPALAIFTAIWILCFRLTWLILHYAAAFILLIVSLSVGDGVLWIVTLCIVAAAVGHNFLYVHVDRAARRRRYERDVSNAMYWQHVNQQAHNRLS